MSAGGTRQALTEEQRQQIIAKLLSERRSQQAAQASSRQAELPQEERAAKLHQLLSRRAAGKQQLGELCLRELSSCCLVVECADSSHGCMIRVAPARLHSAAQPMIDPPCTCGKHRSHACSYVTLR
jgi:CRP-like cAMP-binding protein